MPKKILFYSPVNLRVGGGCERWHCDITNSLSRQFGYEVEIVTGNLGSLKWDEKYLKEQLGGIKYTRLSYPILFRTLIPVPNVFFQLLNIVSQFDEVHFIHGFIGQDIMMLLIKIISGKKIVVGHHAPIFHKSHFHNLYMRYISRFLFNHFDGHMTLNSKDKIFLEKMWHVKNVFFIPSGIKIDPFLSIRHHPHRKLNFITVGIYRHQKGIDILLRAIELFNIANPSNKAIFRFVGDGDLKPMISTFARNNPNIIDVGYVKYEDIPGVYAQSDIYLLASREEPFGLVLIESWSSGIPVLSTKTQGPLDMLKPNINGWFINSITADAICKSLTAVYSKWLNDPKLLSRMVDSCKQTGRSFSIDQTARRMNKHFFAAL